MRRFLLAPLAAILLAGSVQLALSQANYQTPEYTDLGKNLPNAKHTLAEVLMTVTKGTEVPIEAKFEMHEGKLFVGAYTSAKGLGKSLEDALGEAALRPKLEDLLRQLRSLRVLVQGPLSTETELTVGFNSLDGD